MKDNNCIPILYTHAHTHASVCVHTPHINRRSIFRAKHNPVLLNGKNLGATVPGNL